MDKGPDNYAESQIHTCIPNGKREGEMGSNFESHEKGGMLAYNTITYTYK